MFDWEVIRPKVTIRADLFRHPQPVLDIAALVLFEGPAARTFTGPVQKHNPLRPHTTIKTPATSRMADRRSRSLARIFNVRSLFGFSVGDPFTQAPSRVWYGHIGFLEFCGHDWRSPGRTKFKGGLLYRRPFENKCGLASRALASATV